MKCGFNVPGDAIFDEIRAGNVPRCTACKEKIAEEELKPQGLKRKRSSNGQQKDRKVSDDSSDEDDYEIPTPGVMKVSDHSVPCLISSILTNNIA